jgi:hypothetical protein
MIRVSIEVSLAGIERNDSGRRKSDRRTAVRDAFYEIFTPVRPVFTPT